MLKSSLEAVERVVELSAWGRVVRENKVGERKESANTAQPDH